MSSKSVYGKRVTSLEQLAKLAGEKRSVIIKHDDPALKPMPAIFVLSMTGETILRRIKAGMCVYNTPKSKSRFGRWGNKSIKEMPF